MTSSWGDLGLAEDLDDAMEFGHPLVAILVGGGAVLLITILSSVVIGARGHAGLLFLIGLVAAAAVWGVAWFIDLRRSVVGWSVAAGFVLPLLALLVVAIASAAVFVADRRDAAMLGQIRINAQGEPELPGGVKPGPITRSGMDFVRNMLGAAREREAVLIALGMDRLTDAAAVEATPQLATDCDRFERAKPRILAFDQRFKSLALGFRATLNTRIAEPAARNAALKGIDTALGSGFAKVEKISALLQGQLGRAGGLCRLIARHNWRSQGAQFMFTTQGDYDTFGRLIDPWNDAVREIAAMQSTARAESGDRIDPNFRP